MKTADGYGLWVKLVAWVVVCVVLICTLSMYNHPDFLLNLADQLWSCF